jgi:hypothetical protein
LPAQHQEQQQRCPKIHHPHDRRQRGRESAKLLSSKAMVVNVAEKSGHDPGRQG